MVHAALAISLLSGAASVQAPPADAAALLEKAAETLRDLVTVRYDGQLEMRSTAGRRVVTGTVTLAKYTDNTGLMMSGRVAVEGKLFRPELQKIEYFEAAFDGTTVRRYLSGTGVVLQADAGYGGESLLQGSFGSLILWHFLTVDPFMADRDAPSATMMGTVDVDGRPADVVNVKLAEDGPEITWYFDRETRYPVQRIRRFKSARGGDVESVLTISNIVTGFEAEDEMFAVETPEGARVELMGRRPPDPFVVGDVAPDWTLTDGDGVEHTLADYRGQLVVIDFWSTWCPHCRASMPTMERLHDEYDGRGVKLFAINCRERTRVDPVQFVRDRGYDYTVLVDGGKIAPRYRVLGIPAFFVIAPDGTLLFRDSGFGSSMEETIEQYLRQYAQ